MRDFKYYKFVIDCNYWQLGYQLDTMQMNVPLFHFKSENNFENLSFIFIRRPKYRSRSVSYEIGINESIVYFLIINIIYKSIINIFNNYSYIICRLVHNLYSYYPVVNTIFRYLRVD